MDYLTLALLLIAFGVVFLLAEVFVPTGGILIVGALLCFVAGVGTILYYGDTVEAAVAVGGLAIGLPGAGLALVAGWKRMALDRQALGGPTEGTFADQPGLSELAALKGRYGKTVTPMRPSGAAEFDGRRVDAASEGLMIPAGAWVKCVDVKAGRVIVRQVEPPKDLGEMDLDDLK